MTSQARSGSLTRAAIYAQGRRDKETEIRELLTKRLPADAFRPELDSRGDFNITTKTLLATLLFLDPYAAVPDVPNIHSSSAEYNQQRRTNETTIRDRLESTLPKRLFTIDVINRGDLNNTTKVMVAAGYRVEEILRERIIAESSTSILSEAQDMMPPPYSPTARPDETSAIETSQSDPAHQDSGSTLKQQQQRSVRELVALFPTRSPPLPISSLEDTDEADLRRSKYFQPVVARNTRSSSNAKSRALAARLATSSSPTLIPASDDTFLAESSSPEEGDLFANLRADELDQEMNLDVMPHTLPKKVFENQGHWQIKPRDTIGAPHRSVYVRALEQAANRLIAKAKELVIAHGGDDTACQEPLAEAHDWCVDTIEMISGEINRKKYNKKWTAKKSRWDKRNETDSNFED